MSGSRRYGGERECLRGEKPRGHEVRASACDFGSSEGANLRSWTFDLRSNANSKEGRRLETGVNLRRDQGPEGRSSGAFLGRNKPRRLVVRGESPGSQEAYKRYVRVVAGDGMSRWCAFAVCAVWVAPTELRALCVEEQGNAHEGRRDSLGFASAKLNGCASRSQEKTGASSPTFGLS